CTNFLGIEQAMNCKQFPNFPYGKLNAKMKAPAAKLPQRGFMQQHSPLNINLDKGESSTTHQTKRKDYVQGIQEQEQQQQQNQPEKSSPGIHVTQNEQQSTRVNDPTKSAFSTQFPTHLSVEMTRK
ncbi:hypothetical protein MKW92_009062, partial [Papaver armeniacum]